MTPVRRWALVAVVALVVGAAPLVPRLLPAADAEVSAAELLEQVRASVDHSYSGYVETEGGVALPVGDDLGDVGDLLAGRTRLRVWWQDAGAWRVDRLLLSGENDLVHQGRSTIAYDYQDAAAVRTRDPEVRLPRSSDLLPPELARSLLADAGTAEVARVDSRRVGGIGAPGLRYTPSDDRSTIDHVDLWSDPDSGVPLRVEVYGDADADADVVSAFAEFSSQRPADELVDFRPSSGVEVTRGETVDIADAAGRYAPFRVPATLAGLDQTNQPGSAVGVYGEGATRFIALPLRDREADPLREQLSAAPDAVVGQRRTTVADGPLTVLLTGDDDDGGWLLAGSVTVATLEDAAAVLVDLPFVDGDR